MQHAWSLDKHPLFYPGDGEMEAREVISFFYRFSIPALIYVCLLRFSDFIYFYYEESYFIFYPIIYKIPH